MTYKIKNEKGSCLMEFAVPNTDWELALEKSYKKNAKKYKLDGFRKGAAPRKMIERFYGQDVFFDDAFDEIARASYVEVLQKNADIFPVDSPKVLSLDPPAEDGKELKFSMSVTLKPEVTLGDYKGIKIAQVEYTCTEGDIERELNAVRERGARLVPVTDRAIKEGDSVNLDFSGYIDGEKFEGGTAEGHTLVIGSGSFIPGFEPQLMGLEIGAEKDVEVSFPADYHAEQLKGKPAVFKVKINSIEQKELPELNDELIKESTKFETLKEYRADIKKLLDEQNDRRTTEENRIKMLEAVTANVKVEIPECMVKDEIDGMLEEFGYQLQMAYRGITLEQYFNMTGTNEEQYRKDNRENAIRAVKSRLTMQEIIKKEKLDAKPADIKFAVRQFAELKGKITDKEIDEFEKNLNEEQMSSVKNRATIDNLFRFIEKNNEMEQVN